MLSGRVLADGHPRTDRELPAERFRAAEHLLLGRRVVVRMGIGKSRLRSAAGICVGLDRPSVTRSTVGSFSKPGNECRVILAPDARTRCFDRPGDIATEQRVDVDSQTREHLAPDRPGGVGE